MTLTPTATSGQETGWAGTWTAYLQQPNGTYLSGPLTVTITGGSLQGTAAFSYINMTFTGVFSGDSSMTTGSYTLELRSGVFTWQPVSGQYFEGKLDNEFAFCATQPGENDPGACEYIILR